MLRQRTLFAAYDDESAQEGLRDAFVDPLSAVITKLSVEGQPIIGEQILGRWRGGDWDVHDAALELRYVAEDVRGRDWICPVPHVLEHGFEIRVEGVQAAQRIGGEDILVWGKVDDWEVFDALGHSRGDGVRPMAGAVQARERRRAVHIDAARPDAAVPRFPRRRRGQRADVLVFDRPVRPFLPPKREDSVCDGLPEPVLHVGWQLGELPRCFRGQSEFFQGRQIRGGREQVGLQASDGVVHVFRQGLRLVPHDTEHAGHDGVFERVKLGQGVRGQRFFDGREPHAAVVECDADHTLELEREIDPLRTRVIIRGGVCFQ